MPTRDPHRAEWMMHPMDDGRGVRVALQLRERLRRVAEARAVSARWPGGFVPIGVAAYILAVRSMHVRRLIEQKRLPVEEIGGVRMVPVDALIDAPTPIEQGRPSKGGGRREGPHANRFLSVSGPQSEIPRSAVSFFSADAADGSDPENRA
jgi:hypothetical protein